MTSGKSGNKLMRGARLRELSIDVAEKVLAARMALVADHPEASLTSVVFEIYHTGKICSVPVEATAHANREPVS
jgi:hypothetical protein